MHVIFPMKNMVRFDEKRSLLVVIKGLVRKRG